MKLLVVLENNLLSLTGVQRTLHNPLLLLRVCVSVSTYPRGAVFTFFVLAERERESSLVRVHAGLGLLT